MYRLIFKLARYRFSLVHSPGESWKSPQEMEGVLALHFGRHELILKLLFMEWKRLDDESPSRLKEENSVGKTTQ